MSGLNFENASSASPQTKYYSAENGRTTNEISQVKLIFKLIEYRLKLDTFARYFDVILSAENKTQVKHCFVNAASECFGFFICKAS